MPDIFDGRNKWTAMSFQDLLEYAQMDRDQDDFLWIGKFGQNTSLAADTEEDIWSAGGTKEIATTAETVDIVSSSTADDFGGTGANLIQIEGLDSDYNVVIEQITMDGTTTVTTTSLWRRVYRATVIFAGSGQVNAGNITITNTTSGQTMAQILADFGVTQDSHYMVPAGYTGFLISMETSVYRTSGGSGSKSAEITGKFYNVLGNMVLNLGVVSVSSGTVYRKFDAPARIPEKSEYWYTATAASNGTAASVRWNMLMIKNTLLRNPP